MINSLQRGFVILFIISYIFILFQLVRLTLVMYFVVVLKEFEFIC